MRQRQGRVAERPAVLALGWSGGKLGVGTSAYDGRGTGAGLVRDVGPCSNLAGFKRSIVISSVFPLTSNVKCLSDRLSTRKGPA